MPFTDSSDSNKYNAEVIAKAIADGLVGAESFNGNGCGGSGKVGNNGSGSSGQVLSSSLWKLGWNRNNIGWWYSPDNTPDGWEVDESGMWIK